MERNMGMEAWFLKGVDAALQASAAGFDFTEIRKGLEENLPEYFSNLRAYVELSTVALNSPEGDNFSKVEPGEVYLCLDQFLRQGDFFLIYLPSVYSIKDWFEFRKAPNSSREHYRFLVRYWEEKIKGRSTDGVGARFQVLTSPGTGYLSTKECNRNGLCAIQGFPPQQVFVKVGLLDFTAKSLFSHHETKPAAEAKIQPAPVSKVNNIPFL